MAKGYIIRTNANLLPWNGDGKEDRLEDNNNNNSIYETETTTRSHLKALLYRSDIKCATK